MQFRTCETKRLKLEKCTYALRTVAFHPNMFSHFISTAINHVHVERILPVDSVSGLDSVLFKRRCGISAVRSADALHHGLDIPKTMRNSHARACVCVVSIQTLIYQKW